MPEKNDLGWIPEALIAVAVILVVIFVCGGLIDGCDDDDGRAARTGTTSSTSA